MEEEYETTKWNNNAEVQRELLMKENCVMNMP